MVKDILIVTTEPLPDDMVKWEQNIRAETSVRILCFCAESRTPQLPDSWMLLKNSDFLDVDNLRQEFLSFLDDWPKRIFSNGKNFDQLFQLYQGYSTWWVGPGSSRHPDTGPFAKLKVLWIFAKTLEKLLPKKVLIFTKDVDIAALFASKCQRSRLEYGFMPTSAQPGKLTSMTLFPWFFKHILKLVLCPCFLLIRSICFRILAGPSKQTKKGKPAVVLTSNFPQHIKLGKNQTRNWFWTELSDALRKLDPDIRQYHMMYSYKVPFDRFRRSCSLYHSGWQVLRKMKDFAGMEQANSCFWFFIRLIPSQIASLLRYCLLEPKAEFRNSFVFADTNVSQLYIPLLREAVSKIGSWATSVNSISKSLHGIGNVKLVLISQEMYRNGMKYIAAAKKLDIPSVGFQHGTIFPMHLIYTLPPGSVEAAPTCDYFAAYGDYAKEVLSTYGSYPAQKIWSIGSPRFDFLVNNPLSLPQARTYLALNMKKHVVLLATQVYPWFTKVVEVSLETLRNKSDVVLCVKLHPSDKCLSKYQAIAKKMGVQNVRFFTNHFEQLLAACDGLISGSSTSVLEAILLGRKTICVNFSDEPDRYPYVEEGVALAAKSEQELTKNLTEMFEINTEESQQKREVFLQRHLAFTCDGKAALVLAKKVVEFSTVK
jgi:hypothetical protein